MGQHPEMVALWVTCLGASPSTQASQWLLPLQSSARPPQTALLPCSLPWLGLGVLEEPGPGSTPQPAIQDPLCPHTCLLESPWQSG